MNSPKNFFLQLGIIVTLYASVISFLVFLFNIINSIFPNSDYYVDSVSSGIRSAISILVVMFPIFIWLSRLYRKSVSANPELRDSILRKWLLYITLFLAGLAMIIDVIVLVNTFLGGSYALPFVLKVLSVFVVAFGVFYFYLKDIKGFWDTREKTVKSMAYLLSILVLISIVSGIVLIGTPTENRNIGNDMRRVADLQSIQYQITDYYQDKGVLPKDLDETLDPLKRSVALNDPVTKEPYVYEKISDLSFKLCATFQTNSKDAPTAASDVEPYALMGVDSKFWNYEVGQTCFERTIDPDRFPLRNKK